MILRRWEDLPAQMQTDEVRLYYDILKKKRISLFFKRISDLFVGIVLLIVLCPVYLLLAIAIKIDSPGPVFYRQERVTQYGKRFRIHKFRSMTNGADKGSQVTVENDMRITRVGRIIRKYRLDETAQAIDLITGNCSLVGTRPEVPRYVDRYTSEMMATLLLPAGITSLAAIKYKDEDKLLENADNVDEVYVNKVLPGKMVYNLQAIREFSLCDELQLLFTTVVAVFGRKKNVSAANQKELDNSVEVGK